MAIIPHHSQIWAGSNCATNVWHSFLQYLIIVKQKKKNKSASSSVMRETMKERALIDSGALSDTKVSRLPLSRLSGSHPISLPELEAQRTPGLVSPEL